MSNDGNIVLVERKGYTLRIRKIQFKFLWLILMKESIDNLTLTVHT